MAVSGRRAAECSKCSREQRDTPKQRAERSREREERREEREREREIEREGERRGLRQEAGGGGGAGAWSAGVREEWGVIIRPQTADRPQVKCCCGWLQKQKQAQLLWFVSVAV